jgi:(1->4)-alpha-D-glucan 1-alpha-D-glucosylmutase
MNARAKRTVADGRVAPDANEEYLLYQTIAGVWPWREDAPGVRESVLKRLQEYAAKALSEAKVNLSWINPDPEYVAAVQGWIADIIVPGKRGRETPFMQVLQKFLPQIRLFGGVNSLAQVVLKATCPGVPDFYQGTELWDLSLVDPDNRRPVDYRLREKLLGELIKLDPAEGAALAMQRADEGLPKLWTIRQALCLRRERPKSFGAQASYVPLRVDGAKAQHVIAYLRGEDVATVVPRLAASIGNQWDETAVKLPKGRWTNRLTGATVDGGQLRMKEALRDFPVALLVRE